jgi:hypothetical protein
VLVKAPLISSVNVRPMLPLRIVETDRRDFTEPVVELWRDDKFVGMVFWDGEESIVQIYPDDDGDVHDVEVGDLMRVLDLAIRIVTPEDQLDVEDSDYLDAVNAGALEGSWDDEDPATKALTDEFDERVVLRTEDGEGFFNLATALELVSRCEQLSLSIIEVDGFDLEGAVLIPRPELGIAISAPGIADWGVRCAAANAQVRAALESWPSRPTLVATFVIQQRDGETFIA